MIRVQDKDGLKTSYEFIDTVLKHLLIKSSITIICENLH